MTNAGVTAPLYNSWQERLTREESREMQLRQLRLLCEYAEQRSPFYRDHWGAAGFAAEQLRTYDDIRRIPYVAKQDFLRDQNDAPPYGRRLTIDESLVYKAFLTSGTTGIGQEVHCFTRGEWVTSGSGRSWQFRQAGLDAGDAFALTLPLAMQIGGPYLVNAAEKYGLRVLALSSYTTEQKVGFLERFDPHGLQVTPAYAARLEDECRKAGHTTWPGRLKALFVVGESYTDRWIEALEAYWGVPAYEYYGTSQSGMGHAASCYRGVLRDGNRGMLHNLDPYSICEVLDPETGEPVDHDGTGEVIQTPLFKFASPVIRFKTDDRVIRQVASSCPCGLPWDGILAGEVSRYDDMIKAKGQNFWPSSVHELIDAMLPGAEYRGKVFVDDSGRERVALDVEIGDESLVATLAQALRDRTNISIEVTALPPDSLERFEFKSRRWQDTRRQDREVIAYKEKT